ncbi:MAG: glycosyltransferase family 4 protein [Chlorobiales bacterium]|nr:glycosyltransferase family 4 protein [Chlorobiales bacterium]
MKTQSVRVLVDNLFPYTFQNRRVTYTQCKKEQGMTTFSYILKLLKEARKYDVLLMDRPNAKLVGLISNYLRYKPCKLMMYEFQYRAPEPGLVKQVAHQVMKRCIRGLDCVIVHCEFETSWYPELFGTKNTRFAKILFGIMHPPSVGPVEDGQAFSAGVDRDFKTLIEALNKSSVPCTIVGPKNEPNLNAVTNPNITIHQSIPKDQYLSLLRNSKFVIMAFKPSQKMCVGCVTVLEALALGKPLIVTSFPGIAEYIQTEGCIPVPPTDSDALAAAIQKLHNTPFERLIEMGKAAQEHVRNNFENEHFEARYEQEILRTVGIDD